MSGCPFVQSFVGWYSRCSDRTVSYSNIRVAVMTVKALS